VVKSKIDFSLMTYNEAKYYTGADGDWTLQLYFKYKHDLITNHKDLEYLYGIEIIVACAIGYMEFYGHRIDEDKIDSTKRSYIMQEVQLEQDIRNLAGLSCEDEIDKLAYINEKYSIVTALEDEIKVLRKQRIDAKNQADKEKIDSNITIRLSGISDAYKIVEESIEDWRKIIGDGKNPLNIGSPTQIAKLFFDPDKMNIQFKGEKVSVNKKVLKAYTSMKDDDGKPLYPIINKYTEWKKVSTLLTKFFDNLQNFMYPGGFIFSSFGQISTATGRMSCSRPNCQQYPKAITKIVVPREGYIHMDADFSQIEYRVLVALAKEPYLAKLFLDPDTDYHTLMASLMYGVPYALVTPQMRSDAKSFNFGIPYGMGFKSLAILLSGQCGAAQVEEAKEKYELYFKDQPKVKSSSRP